jgi:hypothetical protein
MERPTVSKTRARAPTATVSRGRFSVKIWAMNWRIVRACSSGDISNRQTYGRSGRGSEDQATEVGSALVGEGTGGVKKSTNTVGLEGRAGKGSTPGSGGRSSLLGLEELLLGVGSLGLTVGVTEDGAEDGEGGEVVEGSADGDGRRLDGGKV